MSKRISIGTWAFLFNQEKPIQFEEVVAGLHELKFDGLELGGFDIHPNPDLLTTQEERAKVRQLWESRGMGCSGLAADLWGEKLITAVDNESYMSAFRKNVQFCNDLGISVIRVDSTEDPWTLGDVAGEARPEQVTTQLDYETALHRVCDTWRQCSREAAEAGVRVVWEFEPGFAFNKPSDIFRVLDEVNDDNFMIMFDTCHADNVAVQGARQPGQRETLPGGIRELAERLKGKIGRVHLIDSDGTINEHQTSTHPPFGDGQLDFDDFMPAIVDAGCPDDWWTIDLCFWPHAWDATAKCKEAVDQLAAKHAP